MRTHGAMAHRLTERSVTHSRSYPVVTPDRKGIGREGNRKGRGVGHPSILVSGSARNDESHLPARPVPTMDGDCVAMIGGGC